MFLSRLNEISGGCEKIVKVANAFLRAKVEENCELLRKDKGHKRYEQIKAIRLLTYFRAIAGYFVHYPSNILQHAVNYFTNSLPFTAYVQTYFFFWNNQKTFSLLEKSFKRRLLSHWTYKFEKEGITLFACGIFSDIPQF